MTGSRRADLAPLPLPDGFWNAAIISVAVEFANFCAERNVDPPPVNISYSHNGNSDGDALLDVSFSLEGTTFHMRRFVSPSTAALLQGVELAG